MQSKSETTNRLRSYRHSFQTCSVYSEPWWCGIGYNPMAQTIAGANASNSSSLECHNGDSESNEEGQSLSNNGTNKEDEDVLAHWQMYQFVKSSKVKMEVQVSNPQRLWLYLSNANPIIKQLEEVE